MVDSWSKSAFIESGTLMSSGKGRVLVGWGKREWTATPNAIQTPYFYFPDFFLQESCPWFRQDNCVEMNIEELIEELIPILEDQIIHYEWNNPYQCFFQETFCELQEKFENKNLVKAVPFIFELSNIGMKRTQLIRSVINVLHYALSSPTYLYGFWDQSQGILGATPELLFRFTNSQAPELETVACAATRASHSDMLPLMNDPKELHEHQLVVQGITESLSPFGSVNIGPLKLLKLPQLAHLITTITVNLNHPPNFEEVVKALHPTPALGAFPRQNGMEWLNNLRLKIDRKRYGAPIGFMYKNTHESCCYVAIRSAQWDEEKIFLGAGCGIVAQSQLDREWAEVNLKLRAIKEMLAL